MFGRIDINIKRTLNLRNDAMVKYIDISIRGQCIRVNEAGHMYVV